MIPKTLLPTLALALAALPAEAADPVTLRFQTRLTDSVGAPVSQAGLVVTARLYSTALGGAPFWTETRTVDAIGGLVAFDLGDLTALDAGQLAGPLPVYVGLTVGADSEMVPRFRLGTAPTAKFADAAAAADDVPGKDITPNSITVNGLPVIDSAGNWVGSPTGLVGPQGPTGPDGAKGDKGPKGDKGETGPPGTTTWAGLSGIPAGFADGIDQDSQYGAGPGLDLSGSLFSLAPSGVGPTELASDAAGLARVSGGILSSTGAKVGLGAGTPDASLHLFTGTDLDPSGGGYLTLGNLGGLNLGLDSNEVMARSGGAPTTLFVNVDGGDVVLGDEQLAGQVGVGQDDPTDRLHVSADSGESALRVQVGGATRLRVNANGGVSLGTNSTSVTGGNTFVSGHLGIGDATPEVELDVVGDAIVDGSIDVSGVVTIGNDLQLGGELTVPSRTRNLTIPPGGFVPNFDAYLTSTGGSGDYVFLASSGLGRAYAHLHLPDGAVITRIRGTLLDSSPTDDVRLHLRRQALSATVPTTLAITPAPALSGSEQTVESGSLFATIDNDTYGYFLEWRIPNGSGTIGTLYAFGAQVEYETPTKPF